MYLSKKNTTNDITYCNHERCKQIDCFRNQHNYLHQKHYKGVEYITVADFTDCEHWRENR